MADSWKITLPCTQAEAHAISGDPPALAGLAPHPVLMTSEPDPTRPDDWRLDVYVEGEPSPALIAAVQSLIPSATAAPVVERLDDQDWVTMSQAGLEPISAGRFFVHTAAHADRVPDGAIGLQIEAGLAFGTGQHATTSGCLLELDGLNTAPDKALDVGTGTAVLAFAIARLWPQTTITASDIDPVAIEVSAENAGVNGISLGEGPGEVLLVVAEGLDHERIVSRGPYDLITANILASPLIEMASPIAAALTSGGTLILSGVLTSQAEAVEAAYRAVGLAPSRHRRIEDWSILRMIKS